MALARQTEAAPGRLHMDAAPGTSPDRHSIEIHDGVQQLEQSGSTDAAADGFGALRGGHSNVKVCWCCTLPECMAGKSADKCFFSVLQVLMCGLLIAVICEC